MDTANPLNQASDVSNTQNPQGSVPTTGASNAADFQSTAPSDALTQDAQRLSVQQTGEPILGSQVQASTNWAPFWLGGGILLAIIIIAAIIYKILKEEAEIEGVTAVPTKAASARPQPKTTKKPAKKTTRSGKKKSSVKRKRTTKKR